ncbi:MAG: hypothetical protein HY553_09870 [Elusimicrobia bacterium]|nr:hypothetical protein [Elusimicrobiota bacterium]
MAAESEEPVDPEVIPPGSSRAQGAKEAPPPARTFFHPLSGLVILGVDWLAFGVELPTQFLFTPVVSVIAFCVTFWAISKIQQSHGDEGRVASFKALLGAIAAGVPFPITGTVVGTAILILSGLPRVIGRRLP